MYVEIKNKILKIILFDNKYNCAFHSVLNLYVLHKFNLIKNKQ